MMARMVEGADVFACKLQALREMIPEALRPALVQAGDSGARHAHLVEGGTAERHHKSGASTGGNACGTVL